MNMAGTMEYCCKMGLRLLTVQDKTKMDCMVQADVRMSKQQTSSKWAKIEFILFLDSSYPSWIFMVAATRMGNMLKPSWCFSDVPFDVNVATRNDLNTSLILPTWYVIMMSVTNDSKITGQADNFARFACESL
jgi:hypothetical protein